MAAERRDPDSAREFRLEGAGLLVVGGVLLAAIVGSFFVGRWVERRTHPPSSLAADRPDPLSQVVESDPQDTMEEVTFFDHLDGRQKELEPGRESRPAPERQAEPPRQKPEQPVGDDGSFYVQVFAGRDRSAAEGLVGRLQNDGYGVRLFSEREGSGSLFKVRVGGYPTEEKARLIAADLQKSGYSGAWVTRVE